MILRSTDIAGALRSRRRQRGAMLVNPFVYGSAAADEVTDLVLGLHFDGADGSTTFTDVKGHTITPAGAAQIDTAQSRFGGASGLFGGSGDYLTTPGHADWDLGTNDFTIAAWVYSSSNTDLHTVATTRSASGTDTGFWLVTSSGTPVFITWLPAGGANLATLTSSTPLSLSTWHYLAVTRVGTAMTMWLDGVSVASASVGANAVGHNIANNLVIGRDPSTPSRDWAGWIDDLRILNGTGIYTGPFSPPTSAFPS